MKKFIAGMAVGAVVGAVIGKTYEAAGLAKAVIVDGVDLNKVVWDAYEKGKRDSELVINSWGRKYSTPKKKHE